MSELIIEFYSEEIPAGLQKWAAENIESMILKDFKKANLIYKKSECFWTPMRLSLIISGIPKKTSNIAQEKRGPRLGANEKAIQGFVSHLRIKKNDLIIQNTPNGDFYFYKINKKGVRATLIVENSIKNVVYNFPWKKSMRWGKRNLRWIRPLQNVLCVLDGSLINFNIDHISTSNKTIGHRFMSPNCITVHSKNEYFKKLESSNVLLDANKRVTEIFRKGKIISKRNNLLFKSNSDLVNEVANLVEYPHVFLGKFDKSFLRLPKEILEFTMIKQQKYFPLYKSNGSISNKFLGVSNIKIEKNSKIISGNSRVIMARLTDANFFYKNDLKKGLKNYSKELKNIIFHSKLGSMDQKVKRVSSLCKNYSINFKAKVKASVQSAQLAKADLCSEIVYEMPELQGLIGGIYAEKEGFSKDVVIAISEHYLPLGPLDDCPSIPESATLSFSDKVDSLVGFFMIGEKPRGSRDPFGIRRASLGVIRIIIERNIRIPLLEVIKAAIKNYQSQNFKISDKNNLISSSIIDFIYERLKFYLRDKNIAPDQIESVVKASNNYDLYDSFKRIVYLNKFMETTEGLELISVFKRVRRILYLEEKKVGFSYSGQVKKSLLKSSEEKALYSACIKNAVSIRKAIGMEQYEKALMHYKGIKTKLDNFFDNVLVNDKDHYIKTNRLNLLSMIRSSFAEYADFSLIDVGN